MSFYRRLGIIAFAVGPLAAPASANINLEWRPDTQTVLVGETVGIGLYAVSDDSTDQSISVMDVILDWDPSFLELTLPGVLNNGPYTWLFSGFPDDSGFDDLNGTFSDGDALYNALGQLGTPAYATPDGLLVTTVEFTALAETAGTLVSIPLSSGQFSHTRIIDGMIPGLDVLGTVDNATVTIIPEPGAAWLLGVSALAAVARFRRRTE